MRRSYAEVCFSQGVFFYAGAPAVSFFFNVYFTSAFLQSGSNRDGGLTARQGAKPSRLVDVNGLMLGVRLSVDCDFPPTQVQGS